MKIAITGAKTVTKKDVVKAIEASTFKPSSFITMENTQIEDIISEYSASKKLEYESYSIEWNDLDAPGAEIAINKWDKEFNKNAPNYRTDRVIEECDAMIIIDDGGIEARSSLTKIKKTDKSYYVYSLMSTNVNGLASTGYIYKF
jgi:hypothetical protein